MVHWAASYFVHPSVILKYVNYLQEMKKVGKLSPDVWITSSDNFASWGGGESDYQNKQDHSSVSFYLKLGNRRECFLLIQFDPY